MAKIQIISLFLLSFVEVRAQCTGEPLVLTVGYETMEITSPDYNTNGYPPNTFCRWVITSTVDGAKLLYAVMNMTLNCAGDAINIYNGNTTSAENQLVENDCTSGLSRSEIRNIPSEIAYSGQLYVTFQSDSDKSAREWGFKMLIISGKSHGSCGNETLEANGSVQYITSPEFPEKYAKNLDCVYRIYPGHPDANISLDIHFVDVEFHSSCMYDYITVNGATFCGNDIWQPSWSFVDNVIIVSFHSDDITSKRGYILSFKQLPVDGSWSSWNSTECSVSCGGGTLNRTRRCDSPSPSPDGLPCPGNDTDEDVCNTQPCPVDGSWGQWSNFSECSVSCGGGSMNRTRLCDSPLPIHGGLSCPGNESEIEICNTQHCPVDGSWGQWSNFSECSVSCGGGSMNRTRICDSPLPIHGGLSCIGNAIETETCNTQFCPGDYEIWTPWSIWTECSNACADGLRKSYRACVNKRTTEDGLSCNGTSIKVEKCNVDDERSCRSRYVYAILGITLTVVCFMIFGVILVAKLYGCSLFSRPPKVDVQT